MDRRAIDSLYREHGPFVLRCARQILHNEQAAQDARQEVFVRALQSGSGFRADASPMTWLYRITTNYCLNEMRDTARRGELLRLGAASSGDARPMSAEDRHTARQLLDRVPKDVATIAVHYFINGMKQEEIAMALRVSRRHVRDSLETFLQTARAVIDDEPDTPA